MSRNYIFTLLLLLLYQYVCDPMGKMSLLFLHLIIDNRCCFFAAIEKMGDYYIMRIIFFSVL